jgi:hypothetical protein
MDSFDEFGKALEAELERLRRFVTGEVLPHTRRAAIEALRTASARLEEIAVDLEARTKAREGQPEKPGDANPR